MNFVIKLALSLIIIVAFVVIPLSLWAGPGLSPFGGMVTNITICRCNPDARIMIEYNKVRSVMPDYLTFAPSTSKLYEYANIATGAYILGTTISPDVCVWGHHCSRVQTTELIGIVGTSH